MSSITVLGKKKSKEVGLVKVSSNQVAKPIKKVKNVAEPNSKNFKISKTGVKLLSAMESNPSLNLLPITKVCEIVGISRFAFYHQMRNPLFQQELIALNRSKMIWSSPAVVDSFIEKAKEGSYSHGVKVLEVSGITHQEQRQTNIQIVIDRHAE